MEKNKFPALALTYANIPEYKPMNERNDLQEYLIIYN
jgi:hypothetical protein